MRTLRNMAEEKRTAERMEKLLRQGRFAEARQVAIEHERLLNYTEQFAMSEITNRMSEEDRGRSNLLLRKICILADIVEGAGVDMLDIVHRYDRYVSVPMIAMLKHLKETAHNINRIIDAVGVEGYAESFGDVCDEVDRRIKELFERGKV